MIDPPFAEAQPLGDEVSGTGSPATPTQGVVDPAGVNGFVDPQSAFPRHTFRIKRIEDYRMDRYVTERDAWSLDVIGKCFRFKEMELEDAPDFSSRHPSNIFKVQYLVHFDPDKKEFLPSTVRYAWKRLYFVGYSIDVVSDYELFPVSSFHARVQDRDRFYVFANLDGVQSEEEPYFNNPDPNSYGNFIQGVGDHSPIFMLSPGQMGVLATFAPPMKGFIINNAVLLRLRRSFHIVLSKLNTEGLSDDVYDGYSNLLCCLPFMFLQYDGQIPRFEKCDMFYAKLRDGDVMSIKVGDFAKKSLKSHRLIQRKYDFRSRCYREADRNVRAGDYGKAMQALLKVDAKVNLEGVEDVIMESLPPRVFSNLNEVQRNDLFTYVDNPGSSEFISESVVLQQLRRLKRNRSPGMDGMTVEHLNSIFLGGGRDEVGKKEVLKEYVTFLSRWYKCSLTDNQRRLLHALKLAVIPKNEQDSRVIMMSGIHSKIVFSSFAASKLKKKIEKEKLKNQYGSKPAGAEAMIHIFQQLRESNPDFDIFSADAVKAFYNLNRDLTMMKLKEQAPQVF